MRFFNIYSDIFENSLLFFFYYLTFLDNFSRFQSTAALPMADVDDVLGAPDMGTMFSCPVCREMYSEFPYQSFYLNSLLSISPIEPPRTSLVDTPYVRLACRDSWELVRHIF